MIAATMFGARRSMFVTKGLRATTHCHHNLGYCFRKRLIPDAETAYQIGQQYAWKGKLVYS